MVKEILRKILSMTGFEIEDVGAPTAPTSAARLQDLALSSWGLSHQVKAAAIYQRPIDDLIPFYEDFTNVARWSKDSLTPLSEVPIEPQLDERGGVHRLEAFKVVPGFCVALLDLPASLASAEVCYMACRVRYTGPMPPQANTYANLIGVIEEVLTSGYIEIGVSGNFPQQNFIVISFDGVTFAETDTSIPLDAAWHDFVLYLKDGVVYFGADGAPPAPLPGVLIPPVGAFHASTFAFRFASGITISYEIDEAVIIGSRAV